MPSRLAYCHRGHHFAGAIPARAKARPRTTRARTACARSTRDWSSTCQARPPGSIDRPLLVRRMIKGGSEFIVVDAETQQKRPAFDHEKIAASLTKATGTSLHRASRCPSHAIAFADNERTLGGDRSTARHWRCGLAEYDCRKADPNRAGGRTRLRSASAARGHGPPRVAGQDLGSIGSTTSQRRDRAPGTQRSRRFSFDGSEGNAYELTSIVWSPDSKQLAAYRVKPGYRREVHYVESSPEDQLQPKSSTLRYAKPGDVLDVEQPVIFDVASKTPDRRRQQRCSRTPTPCLVWNGARTAARSRSNTTSAATRCIASSRSTPPVAKRAPSSPKNRRRSSTTARRTAARPIPGKKYRFDVGDGKEVVWMSERDGWNHLVPPRRRDWRGEEPDHQGRLAGARRRTRSTRTEAADLVQRQRHVSGKDP